MTHFRIRFVRRGGHTHFDVFAGPRREATHGKAGSLCLRNEEFDDFQNVYRGESVEFIDNDEREAVR